LAYCTVEDLLIGDIPTSTELDPQKYVNDAADEIDSKIGFRYATPISVVAPTPRPVVLLLKRLNSHLASGRLIMAATILQEDTALNAYGKALVDEAMQTIDAIGLGKVVIAGIETADPAIAPVYKSRVLIANVDATSQVEDFYSKVLNPTQPFVRPYPTTHSPDYDSEYY
jgi:phage gp36-like protein